MNKPKTYRCPNCGGELRKIVWGMPDITTLEAARRGEVYIGGCTLFESAAQYHCMQCDDEYRWISAKTAIINDPLKYIIKYRPRLLRVDYALLEDTSATPPAKVSR